MNDRVAALRTRWRFVVRSWQHIRPYRAYGQRIIFPACLRNSHELEPCHFWLGIASCRQRFQKGLAASRCARSRERPTSFSRRSSNSAKARRWCRRSVQIPIRCGHLPRKGAESAILCRQCAGRQIAAADSWTNDCDIADAPILTRWTSIPAEERIVRTGMACRQSMSSLSCLSFFHEAEQCFVVCHR